MAGLRAKGGWVPDKVEGREGKGDLFALSLGPKKYIILHVRDHSLFKNENQMKAFTC